ncbi:MAG: hypothetical protein VX528_11300, partial [Candidatus Latescibacterota bacterium]|nr:hypothetical protein [Candidatus Latescibacterota bacterium]
MLGRKVEHACGRHGVESDDGEAPIQIPVDTKTAVEVKISQDLLRHLPLVRLVAEITRIWFLTIRHEGR